MIKNRPRTAATLVATMLAALVVMTRMAIQSPVASEAAAPLKPEIYFPIVSIPEPSPCPTSGRQYGSITAYQYDLDDPVRPAELHADKNIELRSYQVISGGSVKKTLVNYGSDDPVQPPQLATLFQPSRVPTLANVYRVYNWNWAPSPDPGTRGDLLTSPQVTALGVATVPGEILRTPSSDYDIGGGMEVMVLFADWNTIALRYTREDSSGSAGYTLHIDGICTDPDLLALYFYRDRPDGPRYRFVSPGGRPYGYPLPGLPAGQPLGTALGGEVVLAIVDSGRFMDPRSCNEWWQIRPGYSGSCPPP
jgi:hypothetical protein